MSKKTVGQIAGELNQQSLGNVNPIDIQREAQKDYIDNLEWCVKHGLKKVDCSHLKGTDRGHETCDKREAYPGDFYVVVLLKKERILENVLKNYFYDRATCPTPDYDQSVFKYHAAEGNLEYLWTIPDKETCEVFLRNIHLVVPEERPLLQMVMDFYDETLLRKARKLNGENIEKGIILERK